MNDPFLPGVPEDLARTAVSRMGCNAMALGSFIIPDKHFALAANTFGWFLERPEQLPSLPGLTDLDWPAVEIELGFPRSSGEPVCFDATIETGQHLIGVASRNAVPSELGSLTGGLVTASRHISKVALLVWLYTEPPEALTSCRAELEQHATATGTRLAVCSYREWLSCFTGEAGAHAARLIARFQL